jgi:hypothetical protein
VSDLGLSRDEQHVLNNVCQTAARTAAARRDVAGRIRRSSSVCPARFYARELLLHDPHLLLLLRK